MREIGRVFNEVHSDDVYVTTPDTPVHTENKLDHLAVMQGFVNAFPDHKIEQPYVTLMRLMPKFCTNPDLI